MRIMTSDIAEEVVSFSCAFDNVTFSNDASFEWLDEELDDATYDRMWSMKGFRQAYHFWKENKRAASPAMHCYVTYISLPWHYIISDLLSSTKQDTVLTFS